MPDTSVDASTISDTSVIVDGCCLDPDCIIDEGHVGVHESRYGTTWFRTPVGAVLYFPPTARSKTVQRSSMRTMQLFGLPTTKVEFNGVMCDVTPTDAERYPIARPGQRKHYAWGGQVVAITQDLDA